MQLPQLLFGLCLAATASAIDAHLSVNGCYTAPALVCVNLNPDLCCAGATADLFATVSFRAIPTDWTIQCRGHSGGNCKNLREIQRASNTRDMCLSNGRFSGAGYGFNANRGRSARPREECVADVGGGCVGSQKPDLLLLEDGTKYTVFQLDDAVLGKFIELAVGGANATSIPAEFAALLVE